MVVEAVAVVLRYLVTVVSKLRLQLSDTKCVCCASNFRVGRALVCSVPGLAMRFQPRFTSLGSPLGAGTRRNAKVAQARLESFRARKFASDGYVRPASASRGS